MSDPHDLLGPVRDLDPLERRLRAGATAYAPAPPSALHGRILAALRAPPATLTPARSQRQGNWVAAAAAVLVLLGAWGLTHTLPARRAARDRGVVALARGLLDAGARVRELPLAAEGNLRIEVERLRADAARAAEGVVRGLPGPLRERFGSM